MPRDLKGGVVCIRHGYLLHFAVTRCLENLALHFPSKYSIYPVLQNIISIFLICYLFCFVSSYFCLFSICLQTRVQHWLKLTLTGKNWGFEHISTISFFLENQDWTCTIFYLLQDDYIMGIVLKPCSSNYGDRSKPGPRFCARDVVVGPGISCCFFKDVFVSLCCYSTSTLCLYHWLSHAVHVLKPLRR